MRSLRIFWIFWLVGWAEAEISFEHVVVDREFFGDCKAIGDLDGDGLPDLVLANQDFLVWYAAPNWTRVVLSREGENFTTDMELADVDRDGDLDILVPDGARGMLRWYENPRPRNDARSGSWRSHLIGTHGRYVHDLEVGDLNRDGKVDVVARPKGSTLFVWIQEAPDSWAGERLGCPDGEGLTLGDLDGDGFPEIVVAGFWYRREADGWKSHRYADWHHPDTFPKVGDLNRDGKADIVLVPSEGTFRIVWYEAPSNPFEGEWREHVIQESVTLTHSLQLADMDGDGSLDVVTAEMAQSEDPDEILIFFNDGKGVAWKRYVVDTTGSHNLQVADLDADGDRDLYGSNWQDPPVGRVEFWRNLSSQRP